MNKVLESWFGRRDGRNETDAAAQLWNDVRRELGTANPDLDAIQKSIQTEENLSEAFLNSLAESPSLAFGERSHVPCPHPCPPFVFLDSRPSDSGSNAGSRAARGAFKLVGQIDFKEMNDARFQA